MSDYDYIDNLIDATEDSISMLTEDISRQSSIVDELNHQLSLNNSQIQNTQAIIDTLRHNIEAVSQTATENDTPEQNSAFDGSSELSSELSDMRHELSEREAELSEMVNVTRRALNKQFVFEKKKLEELQARLNKANNAQKEALAKKSAQDGNKAVDESNRTALRRSGVRHSDTTAVDARKKQAMAQTSHNAAVKAKKANDASVTAARRSADAARKSAKIAKESAKAAKTAVKVGSVAVDSTNPVGWAKLGIEFKLKQFLKKVKPPKAKEEIDRGNFSENANYNSRNQVSHWLKLGNWASPFFLFGLPGGFLAGLFSLILLIIIIILFQLKPLTVTYPLYMTVYQLEQNYHIELLEQIHDYFGIDNVEQEIQFVNNSISWKNTLALWYCQNCIEEDFPFQEDMDPTLVYDMVKNEELDLKYVEKLSDCSNTLNLILVYPESHKSIASQQDISGMSSDEVAELVAGLDADDYMIDEGHILVRYGYEDSVTVEIDSQTAEEYGETLDADIYEHIQRCIAAVDGDDPSVEPVFAEIWRTIKEMTAIDENARDKIVQEAYALWIMSGCHSQGRIPVAARDAYGVDSPFDYTFYREASDGGAAIPFTFHYENTSGNTSSNVPFNDYERNVPAFLNGSNGMGISFVNGTLTTNVGGSLTRNIKHHGYNWSAYSYYCSGVNTSRTYNEAWCAAFVTSLAQNMYRDGCFFVTRTMFIDADHPSWTLNDYGVDFSAAQTTLANSFNTLLNSSSVQDKMSALTAISGYITTWGTESIMNNLRVQAKTDYYRINLMSTPSKLNAGLMDYRFTPASSSSGGYSPSGNLPSHYLTKSPVYPDHTGHVSHWYYPYMQYRCELYHNGEGRSGGEDMYGRIAYFLLIWERLSQDGGNVTNVTLDLLVTLLNGSLNDELNAKMDDNCALFSELYEETQGLFPKATGCTSGYLQSCRYNSGCECYTGNALKEMYEATAGDIILYGSYENRKMTHIGLVVWVDPDNPKHFVTIEGNSNDTVTMKNKNSTDSDIGMMVHVLYGHND